MSKQPDIPATLTPALPDGYADWLKQLKTDIARAQQRAALSVNTELVQLYGRIGRDILLRQEAQGWGAKVIERLARDLKDAFPDMRGWSSSNLKYMAFFAQRCLDGKFGQQPAAQFPWFHIVILLTKLDTIGLLLCKKQNRLVAEYALSGIEKPIGVAEYQLLRDLPETLGKSLPNIEEIEAELAGDLSEQDEPR